jgi:hypothetical protein
MGASSPGEGFMGMGGFIEAIVSEKQDAYHNQAHP